MADFLTLFGDGFEDLAPPVTTPAARTVPPRRPRPEPTAYAYAPHQPMVECIKMCQRSSTYWRTAWQMYCQLYGNSLNDPAKHDESFCRSFLDYIGEVAQSETEKVNLKRG